MAAKQGHACRRLGLEMEIRLRAGIPLCRDTLAFMASTFSIESPRDLRIVLADPDDSDTQSLLELLFTPDETTRIDLENIIERSSCTDEDEQVVIHDLFHKNIKVPISFPGAEDRLIYNPTRHHLKTWVRGLKITTHLPPALVAAVNENASGRLQARIKTTLRSTRVGLTVPICRFLGQLMEKTPITEKPFWKDLELCLAILGEQPETPSPFDLFMAQKRRLLEMLQQAARFEKQLTTDNIETLILKGVRAPHIDKADARDKIARIDAICLAVFGFTDSTQPVPTDMNLGHIANRDDLDKAFEILS